MGCCTHTVRTLSDDIQMKFAWDKKAHFVNGKLSGCRTAVPVGKPSRVEPCQVYHLGMVDASNGIQHNTTRKQLHRETSVECGWLSGPSRMVERVDHQRLGTTGTHAVLESVKGPGTCNS